MRMCLWVHPYFLVLALRARERAMWVCELRIGLSTVVDKMWKTWRCFFSLNKTFCVLLCPQKKIDLWQQLANPEKQQLHAL